MADPRLPADVRALIEEAKDVRHRVVYMRTVSVAANDGPEIQRVYDSMIVALERAYTEIARLEAAIGVGNTIALLETITTAPQATQANPGVQDLIDEALSYARNAPKWKHPANQEAETTAVLIIRKLADALLAAYAAPADRDYDSLLALCEPIAKRLCDDDDTRRWPTCTRILVAALKDDEFSALARTVHPGKTED